METKQPHIGQIIHQFRIDNDITAAGFAASCGRSRNFTTQLEKTGRGYERTWGAIGRAYPDLKQKIIQVIGRYPPQEYARICKNINEARRTIKV